MHNPKVKRGMVFGVFDGLHEGHRYFLSSAAKLCDELMVVVAPDQAVRKLKGHAPEHPYKERVAAIHAFRSAYALVEGDAEMGEWQVFNIHKPAVVILGYDQHTLLKEIQLLTMPYKIVGPFEPTQYKSSVLNGRRAKQTGEVDTK